MKVEIELAHLERLQVELANSKQRESELEEELKGLQEKELIKKAVRLSYKLFEDYVKTSFEHLGFEYTKFENAVIIKDNLEHWIGNDWYRSDRIKIEIGASVINDYKTAFLKIGIITKDSKTDKYEHKLE